MNQGCALSLLREEYQGQVVIVNWELKLFVKEAFYFH